MLIIEGPDMVGKTTIVDKLMPLLPGVKRVKRGLPEAEWNVDKWINSVEHMTVSDRSYMSEVVYGLSCRGRCNVDPKSYGILDDAVEDAAGVIVMINATPEAYMRLMAQHYDPKVEAFTPAQCVNVNLFYERFIEWEVADYRPWADIRFTIEVVDGKLVRPGDEFIREIARDYTNRQSDVGAL